MDVADLDPNPITQVERWLADARAAGVVHAEAMALATAASDGRPSVRMVLLKGCDERGFGFFTNVESRKAEELDANPHAAVVLYWQPLDRQVRAEGTIERVTDDEARSYFDTRPIGSRLAAWASPQSREVESRAELERLYARVADELGDDAPPLPPHWGGYRLRPDTIEFWESRPNRLHDRIRYDRKGDGWAHARLAP